MLFAMPPSITVNKEGGCRSGNFVHFLSSRSNNRNNMKSNFIIRQYRSFFEVNLVFEFHKQPPSLFFVTSHFVY